MGLEPATSRSSFRDRPRLLSTLLLLSLLLPPSALAITNGVADDEHDYVGAYVGTATDPATGDTVRVLLCTGTVVAPRVVLTAAHCFLDLEQLGVGDVQFTLDEVLDENQDGLRRESHRQASQSLRLTYRRLQATSR